ncbi:hypothetical protein [Sporosarcina obsidiansis]|uniref:hypothetical protein n=1 Tax=Sporosarcina obsidiansis TaxID=2660748 RepID=UPI00129B7345|nr:hypothetical protein [Sporosarcina obsidiansis]
MKKWWILPVLAVFLVACGNETQEQPKEDDAISVDSIEPEKNTTESTDSEMSPEGEQETPPVSFDSELSAFEEFAILAENIPLDELTSHIETDNPGKRIILFENESGKKVYKSIFVKHDQYLKVIDLEADQLLFEGNVEK